MYHFRMLVFAPATVVMLLPLCPAWSQANRAPAAETHRATDGDGNVVISGEAKQWHKLTFSLAGPCAREQDEKPNPFTDFRFTVHLVHESGSPRYDIPCYFAADGRAAETSATPGTERSSRRR